MAAPVLSRLLTETEFMYCLDEILFEMDKEAIGGPGIAHDDADFTRVFRASVASGFEIEHRRFQPMPEDVKVLEALAYEQVEAGEPYD